MEEKITLKSVVKEIVEYIIWLAGVFVAVQLIVNFVGVVSQVDGESMEPNFYNGQYLWVDKVGYYISDPDRYDVIIFPVDHNGVEKHFIKRIIGLPGETVYIDEQGGIYINGELILDIYGKELIVAHNRHRAAEPITLGEDEYFVLGDNRNHSSDSRYEFVGNVKRSDIVGRVVVRLWPLNSIGFIK